MPEVLNRREVARRAMRTLLFASLIGAIAGVFTAAFMFLIEAGKHFFWEGLPLVTGLPYVGIVVVLGCALGVGFLRRHTDKEIPFEEEFGTSGRISYTSFPRTLSTAMLSLWSGASVGPEALLSHLSAQISTFTVEKLRLPPELGRSLVLGGVAGAFGAFLGSPVVGTFLVFEMFEYKKYDSAGWILPAFLASAISYTLYLFFMPSTHVIVFDFPFYTEASIVDVLWSVPLASCGAILGIAFGYLFKKFSAMTNPFIHTRPVLLALIGGGAIIVTALIAPIALFSGHDEIPELIAAGAAISTVTLLLILVVKILLTAIGFHTGFKGGPIFPLIFIGTAAGMLISHLFPFVPADVAIIAVATGIVVLELRLPVSTIILMTVLSGVVWMPVIIFAAFVSYIWLIFVTSLEKQPELIKLVPG